MRIIIACFGDKTRSGTLYKLLSWCPEQSRITDNVRNVFNGVTSPCVFPYLWVLQYFLSCNSCPSSS